MAAIFEMYGASSTIDSLLTIWIAWILRERE